VTVATLTADAGISFDNFYRFHVALFNQDASPAVDRNGKTWPADVIYEVNAACKPPVPPEPDAAAPTRDASVDVSVPPMDGAHPPPPDAHPAPSQDATTPMDASKPRGDSAPPPDAADAAHRPDAGRLPDAQTP
jgi:hypothetical protein